MTFDEHVEAAIAQGKAEIALLVDALVNIGTILDSIHARLDALESGAASPDDPPSDPPDDPPDDPPGDLPSDPPDDPPDESGADHQVSSRHTPIDNSARVTYVVPWMRGANSYERYQGVLEVSGVRELEIRGWAWTPVGPVTLSSGAWSATVAITGSVTRVALDSAQFADGWHKIGVASESPLDNCMPAWIFVRNNGVSTGPMMPVHTGSHDGFKLGGMYQEVIVPARHSPTIHPLPVRAVVPEPQAITSSTAWNRTQLVPLAGGNVYRPARTRNGLVCAQNRQPYVFHDVELPYPQLPLIDGPRGHGTLANATWLQPGHEGQTWFTDSWSFGRIRSDGTVHRLVGFRDPDNFPVHWESATTVERDLLGDWSAVPAPRGIWGCWGAAWDARTTTIDESGNHPRAPTVYLTSPHHGRVYKVVFDRLDRDLLIPPTVTILADGLDDPWSCEFHGEHVYISDRGKDRLVRVHADTGALESFLEPSRRTTTGSPGTLYQRIVTLEQARAEVVCGPEGLDIMGDWLYYASLAQGQIRRINLVTGVTEIPVPNLKHHDNNNSNFCQIAVSDGSFFPQHTAFASTWNNVDGGFPLAYAPTDDGTPRQPVRFYSITGAGSVAGVGPAESMGYSCAVGVGRGVLVCSSSSEGVVRFDRRQAGDRVVDNARYKRGKDAYYARGLPLRNGHGGWGHYGLSMPGLTDDEAYYVDMSKL